MGFIVSLLIIAIGAILTWGVTDNSDNINLDVVGVVLMIVGLIGFILTLLFWESWWGPGYFRRGAAPAARSGYGGYSRPWRRGSYVVEEEVPPEPPPGPGPPP